MELFDNFDIKVSKLQARLYFSSWPFVLHYHSEMALLRTKQLWTNYKKPRTEKWNVDNV